MVRVSPFATAFWVSLVRTDRAAILAQEIATSDQHLPTMAVTRTFGKLELTF